MMMDACFCDGYWITIQFLKKQKERQTNLPYICCVTLFQLSGCIPSSLRFRFAVRIYPNCYFK
jgi:hypothetical protein